eukprot:gene7449-1333_t
MLLVSYLPMQGPGSDKLLEQASASWLRLDPRPDLLFMAPPGGPARIKVWDTPADVKEAEYLDRWGHPSIQAILDAASSRPGYDSVAIVPPHMVLPESFPKAATALATLFPTSPGHVLVGPASVLYHPKALPASEVLAPEALCNAGCHTQQGRWMVLAQSAVSELSGAQVPDFSMCSDGAFLSVASLAQERGLTVVDSRDAFSIELQAPEPDSIRYAGFLQGFDGSLLFAGHPVPCQQGTPVLMLPLDQQAVSHAVSSPFLALLVPPREAQHYNQGLLRSFCPTCQQSVALASFNLQICPDSHLAGPLALPFCVVDVVETEEDIAKAPIMLAPSGRQAPRDQPGDAPVAKAAAREDTMPGLPSHHDEDDDQPDREDPPKPVTGYDKSRFTIFATPKPQTVPHIAMIQRNAVMSWAKLRPKPNIIIYGQEEGLDELAATTMNMTDTHSMVFINADILLPQAFADALMTVVNATDNFLMSCVRWRQCIYNPLDFSDPNWDVDVFKDCNHPPGCKWKQDSPRAIDFFAFTRNTWQGYTVKPFMIGRPAFDNYLVTYAAKAGTPIVSCHRCVRPVHQNHNYAHLGKEEAEKEICEITGRPGGKKNPLFTGSGAMYNYWLVTQDDVRGDNTWFGYELYQAYEDCPHNSY